MQKVLSPKADIGKRALEEPLPRRPSFELLNEFRVELLTLLDIVTLDPHGGGEKWSDAQIQQIADRLKLITNMMPKAIRSAINASRIEYCYTDEPHCPFCHQQIEDRQ